MREAQGLLKLIQSNKKNKINNLKYGLLRRSHRTKHLIVDFKIFWFVLLLKFSDLYKGVRKNLSSG